MEGRKEIGGIKERWGLEEGEREIFLPWTRQGSPYYINFVVFMS